MELHRTVASAAAGFQLKSGKQVSQRHVDFQKQNMKVNSAVQTISDSVAKAVQFNGADGLLQFSGSECTIEYITMAQL